MSDISRYEKYFRRAQETYKKISKVYCPYFEYEIPFTSDGFNHLQFSAGRKRDKKVQMLKFSLLPAAVPILRRSGTLQEHRKTMQVASIGRHTREKGRMVYVEYWGFVAIVPHREHPLRIKVIVRKVGAGNPHFWSIMPAQKLGVDSRLKVSGPDMEHE